MHKNRNILGTVAAIATIAGTILGALQYFSQAPREVSQSTIPDLSGRWIVQGRNEYWDMSPGPGGTYHISQYGDGYSGEGTASSSGIVVTLTLHTRFFRDMPPTTLHGSFDYSNGMLIGTTNELDLADWFEGGPGISKLTLIRARQKAVIGKLGGETVKGEAISRHLAGAELGELQEGMPHYGEINGVLIVNVKRGSPAAEAGLQKHDIISSVNKRKVENLDDVSRAVQNPQNPILLYVQRGGAMFLLLSRP